MLGQLLGEASSTNVDLVQAYHLRSCTLPTLQHPREESDPGQGKGCPSPLHPAELPSSAPAGRDTKLFPIKTALPALLRVCLIRFISLRGLHK